MPPRRKSKGESVAVVLPFHQRFDITLDNSTAKSHFVNRSLNYIGINVLHGPELDTATRQTQVMWQLANGLGHRYLGSYGWTDYVGQSFYSHLKGIEILYRALPTENLRERLSNTVQQMLFESEIDLGIAWRDGYFVKSGAELLDERLVNDPLRWLSQPEYVGVKVPFEKGLRHFLEGERDQGRLADAVTDVYEALEALSKIVTGRPNKDLSANAELMLKALRVSAAHKPILKELIAYANLYRHALAPGETRPVPQAAEVESFIYLCGVFIRVALQTTAPGP